MSRGYEEEAEGLTTTRGAVLTRVGPGVESVLKFLVVDDSRTVHAFMRACLQQAEGAVEMESAMDGAEAVEKLRARPPPPPDLIFLDWEMPRKNGPDTFHELRELGVQTPIIMLTSKSDIGDITRMLDAGVDEYVMKPFTADIILEKASAVLGVEIGHGSR